jgi:hypothetical protein
MRLVCGAVELVLDLGGGLVVLLGLVELVLD